MVYDRVGDGYKFSYKKLWSWKATCYSHLKIIAKESFTKKLIMQWIDIYHIIATKAVTKSSIINAYFFHK